MSKLVTDSKFLMEFLFDGTDAEDTPINNLIKILKNATLSTAETRACSQWMTDEEIWEHLDVINTALVQSWQQMLSLRNEFKDLIEKHFEQ